MSVSATTGQVSGPAIHVRGLEKSYQEVRVLRGVDLEVARGSIFALLGSNGAGKTTVVRILSTLLRADAGTARVNVMDVATQAADVRGSISLTGQFAAVDEILTGRENLILVARLRHLRKPGSGAPSYRAPRYGRVERTADTRRHRRVGGRRPASLCGRWSTTPPR